MLDIKLYEIKKIASSITPEFMKFVSKESGTKVDSKSTIYYNKISDYDKCGIEERLIFKGLNGKMYNCYMLHNSNNRSIVEIKEDEYNKTVEKINSIIEYKESIIKVNDSVEVVKGRKVKHGTSGKVIQINPNQYSDWNEKVIIEDSEGNKYYTYINNLKKIRA